MNLYIKNILLFLLLQIAVFNFAQGAGRTIYFDGDEDYVNLPAQNVEELFAPQFTLEFWVNPGNTPDRPTFGFMSGHYNKFNPISSYDNGLNFGDGDDYQLIDTLQTAPANTWTHYAIVDDGAHYNVYVNGFLVNSAIIQVSPHSNDTRTFMIGDSGFDSPYDDDFKGYFEEFRIWDIGFTQDEIRENMCKKISTTHPYFNHLKCCLRFDESSGTIAYDISNYNNDGTMNGIDASIDAIWSGAPIGDDAVYDATGNIPEDFSVTLSHPEGDYMTITGDGGTITSIFLYRVDDTALRPDATIPDGWTIDQTRFWGIFTTGDNPSYHLRYYYEKHSGITNEDDLIFAFRDDNNDNSWENSGAIQNLGQSYFELNNQNGTEYALASENGENSLPISLAILNISLYNSKPLIKWVTQSEINILGWNVYRSFSSDREEAFRINENIIPARGSSSENSEYEFYDEYPLEYNKTYYYWLEYVELSGITNFFGPLSITISNEELNEPEPIVLKSIFLQNYPNPFNPQTNISFKLPSKFSNVPLSIKIFNSKGQFIKELYCGYVEENQIKTVEWDGKDRFGKPVAQGIYYYILKSKKIHLTKKMVMIK